MAEKQKLVLIDGYSLLNRAFYAVGIFTNKDGLPTNGIFGFVKLLFKIIAQDDPEYLAVAFDVHAPTFRHKMFDDYKGTRKPMPEELLQQVPVLKELLSAMNIRCVEAEGYEADDVIGTLSRRFDGVDTYIYTGDRDSYQLVNDHVSICYTKRGVTDVDLLTQDNFVAKVGIEPWQIVEEKALMGDVSDNIPGVDGIGPKTALTLLQTYGSIDAIYQNIERTTPAVQRRLIIGEASARLSRTLALIKTDVPLDVTLESCRLVLPFPSAAREIFAKLEFRSMIDSEYFVAETRSAAKVAYPSVEAFLEALPEVGEFCFCMHGDRYHFYLNDTEYIFKIRENFLDDGVFFGDLKPVLDKLFSGEKYTAIVVDFKSLAHKFDGLGIEIKCNVEDISLLRYLVDSNARALLASDYVKDYALSDENWAYALRLAYDEAVKKTAGSAEWKLYRDLELPLSHVLLDMERYGVNVDVGKFPEFSEKYRAEMNELAAKIYALADVEPFNLNSTFQLSEVLFGKLGLAPKGAKKNIRGGYSTSAEVLERLADSHEVVGLILRYRELQKLQSTYIDGILPLVNGGIVHTTYNQMMTTTGRLSSTNPNLQNIPVRTREGRELRKLFIPREGNMFIDADYSQIELRLLAHLSGCPALIDAYKRGDDIHAATASLVFGVPLQEVTPEMRRKAKSVNFGIIYGMSAFGLAKDIHSTQQEAQEYINKYFELHPEVRTYMDGNVQFAKENGYVTTILGRKRHIPELKSSNYNLRQFGERAVMNMPLQGSAADIIKLAMLGVTRRLKEEGLKSRLVLQVHDELILDAPIEEEERAKQCLKEEMENAMQLSVPLIADVSVGKSWYDAKG